MVSVIIAFEYISPLLDEILILSPSSICNCFAFDGLISQKSSSLYFKRVLGRFVLVPLCHWSLVLPVRSVNGYVRFVFSLRSLFSTK